MAYECAFVLAAEYSKCYNECSVAPRKNTGLKRGGQEKDTEKWAVSVKLSTIEAFENVAGWRARTMAARFLDDLAPALVALAPKKGTAAPKRRKSITPPVDPARGPR
jgi:hypothetical protein